MMASIFRRRFHAGIMVLIGIGVAALAQSLELLTLAGLSLDSPF